MKRVKARKFSPIKKNSLIVGDALEVMHSFKRQSFGLVVTSPPYNLRNSSGNGMKDGRGSKWIAADDGLRKGYDGHSDDLSHDDYVSWQRSCLKEMMRVLRPDGAIFYNHKWRVQGGLIQDRADILEGFPVRQIIIWQRSGGINFNKGYFLPTYEVIYLIAKPDFKLAPKANAHGDVWTIHQETNNPHPAAFPLALATRIIESTTAKTILDPFIGSGTTALAAKMLNRNYVGVDISKEYIAMARERLDRNE